MMFSFNPQGGPRHQAPPPIKRYQPIKGDQIEDAQFEEIKEDSITDMTSNTNI